MSGPSPKAGDLEGRRSRLTPAQRALFEKRLRSGLTAPDPAAEAAPAIPRRPEGGPGPLSFAQERLWHFAARHPGSADHNVYHGMSFAGALDLPALAASVRAVVERHEALHTRFEAREGGVVAVVAPDLLPPLALADLSALADPSRRDAEALHLVSELVSAPFDLARGPLVRTLLLRTGPREHALILGVHHIVIDGWSLAVFGRDLATAYEAFASGRPPAFPAVLQAGDFACWQRDQVATGALDPELGWWRRHLAGAPAEGLGWPARPLALPGRSSYDLDPSFAQMLKTFAQTQRATLFMTILAGLLALLNRHTGEEDLVVGTPMALRGRPETADLVGVLLNLLPLRTDLAGDPPFSDLLERVRGTALGAFAHRHVPFERLAEELAPGRDPGSTPWVRVFFNMPTGGTGHPEPIRSGGLAVQPLLTGEVGSEFDLTFYAREYEQGIRLDLGYKAELLTPAEAGALLAELAILLREAGNHPERRLSELAPAVELPRKE